MYLFCRLIIMYKTTVSVVRSFHDKKNPALQDSPFTAGRLERQHPFRRSAILPGRLFNVMRNRNFLLQKNTACQAVFTALTSGIKLLNIVISNKLVGLFVVVVVDGIHLIQQRFPVQSAAGTQCFQRIVIIPKLGIYITKQNHRIFWYHKTWTPFLFLYLLLFTPFTVTRFAMHRNHAFA